MEHGSTAHDDYATVVIRLPAYCIKSMRLLVVRIAVNDLLREM